MKPTSKPKTVQQFLKELETDRMSIAAWARSNKQPVMTVYMLCYGRIHGTRGKSRDVAKAMGLALPDLRDTAQISTGSQS